MQGVNAQKPLVQAEIVRTDHPVFYGYADKILPIKYASAASVLPRRRRRSEQRARAVRRRRRVGAERPDGRRRRDRAASAFVVDIPEAYHGKGRVIMFANNPVYRWQNHGEFNMMFNSILNWNDIPAATTGSGTRH